MSEVNEQVTENNEQETETEEQTVETYTTVKWEKGKIITAVDLNRMEQGILTAHNNLNQTISYVNELNYADDGRDYTVDGMGHETAASDANFVSGVTQIGGQVRVSHRDFAPSIAIVGATSEAGENNSDKPRITFSVAGNSATSGDINTATISVYGVTKLSNTADTNVTDLAATPKAVRDAIDITISALRGADGGLAELDDSGHVPADQLPSYVDDVIEGYYYNNAFYTEVEHTNVITKETGKIYVDLSTNNSYRWGGSVFVLISSTDKADKVANATSGNFAALDANGNLTDSGHKHSDYLTSHQSLTNYAQKMDVIEYSYFARQGNITNSNTASRAIAKGEFFTTVGSSGFAILYVATTAIASGDVISTSNATKLSDSTLKGLANYIRSIKADKVTGAINGNFAALDSNGNLFDSGHKHSDYTTSIAGKADKQDTVLNTTLQVGSGHTISGNFSTAIGIDSTVSGNGSLACGSNCTASGTTTFAQGTNTTASGTTAFAQGTEATASGNYSHAMGQGVVALAANQSVIGKFNVQNNMSGIEIWSSSITYNLGDIVKFIITDAGNGVQETLYYKSNSNNNTNHMPLENTPHWSKIDYVDLIEIVGNGTSNSARLNARALDIDGNERLKGNLYVNCNNDSTGGIMIGGTSNGEVQFSDGTDTVTFTMSDLQALYALVHPNT